MKMTKPVRKKMDGKVFVSRQSWHFLYTDNIIKVLFPTLYIDLACKQLCFAPGERFKLRNEKNVGGDT